MNENPDSECLDIRSFTSSLAQAVLRAFESAGAVFPDAFKQSGLLKNLNQDIRSYYPLIDSECFTIQTADVICNFLAASFAVELGSKDEKSKLKRKIVCEVFPFEEEIPKALQDMELFEGRLRAKPSLRAILFNSIYIPSAGWYVPPER